MVDRDQVVESCDLCGSSEKADVHSDIDMVRCRACGLVYVDRRVHEEDLGSVYGEAYFRSSDSQELGYDDYVGERPNLARTFDRRVRNIERALGRRGGRLLDIGCATGFFLDVARSRGFEVQGVEISAYAAGVARQELGLDVHLGPLRSFPRPEQAFDVITLWDVIEHSLGPLEDLRQVASLLRPGGLLVLATPDVESWPARLYGRRWIGIKEHEHFFYFSRPTISRCLEETGFSALRFGTIGKYVSMGFFIKRIGHYYPWLAQRLMALAGASRLLDRSVYVDPRDLMIVYARRNEVGSLPHPRG
jgi:2-polyprenyl-3-methyl-5-hydroxy-6-metoxy-1,4-benzoquinol methylase